MTAREVVAEVTLIGAEEEEGEEEEVGEEEAKDKMVIEDPKVIPISLFNRHIPKRPTQLALAKVQQPPPNLPVVQTLKNTVIRNHYITQMQLSRIQN